METARTSKLLELRRSLPACLPARASFGDAPRLGLDSFDRLVGGGFPRGAISVLTGSPGTGRMSLAAKLLASETRRGHPVAWIDAEGTLYPPALALMGVDLGRLLMVRGGEDYRSVYAAEQIIASAAFSVVVASGIDRWLTSARLVRLQTSTEAARACSLLIVHPRSATSIPQAALKLRLQRRANGVQVEVEKSRTLGSGRRAFLTRDQFLGVGVTAT